MSARKQVLIEEPYQRAVLWDYGNGFGCVRVEYEVSNGEVLSFRTAREILDHLFTRCKPDDFAMMHEAEPEICNGKISCSYFNFDTREPDPFRTACFRSDNLARARGW